MQLGLHAKELERPHPDFLVAKIGVHEPISPSARRQVNGYRLLREPRDFELVRAGHEHCLVYQLLASSVQRVNDRLHPGPLLVRECSAVVRRTMRPGCSSTELAKKRKSAALLVTTIWSCSKANLLTSASHAPGKPMWAT